MERGCERSRYRWPLIVLLLSLALAAGALAAGPWEDAAPAEPLAAVWDWLGLGYFERALDEAARAVRSRPLDREAHLILALLLQERGDGDRAEREYRLAYPEARDRSYLDTALGQLCLARDEWDEAAGYFHDALKRSADLGQAKYGLAQAMAGAGDRRGAVDLLRRLVKDQPSWPGAVLFLGDLLATAGAGPGELMALYEKAVADNPFDIELRLRLARAYDQQGQYGKAREQYARILRLEPENEEARRAISRDPGTVHRMSSPLWA